MKKIYLLLFSLSLFLIGCEKDELEKPEVKSESESIATIPKGEAIQFLKKRIALKNNKKSQSLKLFYEGFRYDSILNSNALMAVIPAETKYKNVESSLLLLEVNGVVREVLYHLVPTEESINFTGRLIISDLEMQYIAGFRVMDGKLIARLIIKENEGKTSNCGDRLYKDPSAIYDGCLGEILLTGTTPNENHQPIPYVSIMHIYPNNYGGGSNDDSYYIPGAGGGAGTVSSTNDDSNEVKILNELKGKADCTYQKLLTTNLLKNTLQKFMGEKTPIHLILKEKSNLRNSNGNGNLLNGQTIYGDSFYITILINTEQATNRRSLDVARTIIHEAIHAEIFRKIKSTSTDISRLIINKNSWPTLFDYYNTYPGNPQHNYMADYYRTAMVKGLKEFASLTGQSYPDKLYEDLAWAGLKGTKAWNNMFQDPIYTKQEQDRILKSIISFNKSGKNECE